MSESPEFKVSFGPTAGTLVYEDQLGVIMFACDISPSEESTGRYNLHLGRQPLTEDGKFMECKNPLDRERVALALDRTRQYVSSRGYHHVGEQVADVR